MATQRLQDFEQRPLADVMEFEGRQLGEAVILNHARELVEITLFGLAVEADAS